MNAGNGKRRERVKLADQPVSYFVSDKPKSFVSTGCTLLDCALSGGQGMPLGRVVNIIGDKSTAKTALATEIIINFTLQYPQGAAAYRDVEAAFDQEYAAAMGMPVRKVDFGDPDSPLNTVEDFERDLTSFIEAAAEDGKPGIYVLDSLDALSDEAEMERKVGEGSYGTSKAKGMSAMFRKLTRKIESSKVLLIVISQIREKIGFVRGDKHTRSGGKALDFYASQILYLTHLETLKKSIKKIERPIGIHIRANVKKNKVGLAMRKCDFDFLFGFGIDDLNASIDWLDEVNKLQDLKVKDGELLPYLNGVDSLNSDDYRKGRELVGNIVRRTWREVETTFLPTRRKYD